MRRNFFILGFFVVIALLSGCATTSTAPIQTQRKSAVIESSKENIWPLLVSEVGLNYPVQAIDKESGLLTTQFVQMPVGYNNSGMERYVFPPGSFLATWRGLRMNMRIMVVESEEGKTMVRINAHYEAFENNVSKAWLVAQSNGALENQILSNIEFKLRNKKTINKNATK